MATDQAEKAIEPLNLAVALVPIGWSEPYTALETAYTSPGDAEHARVGRRDGRLRRRRRRDRRARACWRSRTATSALEATVGLGLIAEPSGDTAAAGDWYRKALAIDPENSTAKLGLGRVTLPSPAPSSALPSASPSTGSGSMTEPLTPQPEPDVDPAADTGLRRRHRR